MEYHLQIQINGETFLIFVSFSFNILFIFMQSMMDTMCFIRFSSNFPMNTRNYDGRCKHICHIHIRHIFYKKNSILNSKQLWQINYKNWKNSDEQNIFENFRCWIAAIPCITIFTCPFLCRNRVNVFARIVCTKKKIFYVIHWLCDLHSAIFLDFRLSVSTFISFCSSPLYE